MKFSTLSESEIGKIGEVQVWKGAYYESFRMPTPGGLLDSRMNLGVCLAHPHWIAPCCFGVQQQNTALSCFLQGSLTTYDRMVFDYVYGGEAKLATLSKLFPFMEDEKSLVSAEQLAKVKGKASLLADVDYYVRMHSDIFISTSPGNMHNALVLLLVRGVA